MRRPWLLGILLVLSLVLMGVLTLQAQRAARSHRAVAEGVLRDYAALAASEFARRTLAEVGYQGYYRLASALGERPGDGAASRPTRTQLRERLTERNRDALELGRYFFELGPAGLETWGGDTGDTDPVRRWLTQELRERTRPPVSGQPPPYLTVHSVIHGFPHTFVVVTPEPGDDSLLLGFEVDRDSLRARFQRVIDGAALLPPSLGAGQPGNDWVYLQLTDPTGRELWRAGAPYPSELGAEHAFGDDYNGLFDGFVVYAAVDPAAADRLVIGGLPRSRLPFLLLLLGLCSALVVTALLQLRSEHALVRMRSEFVSRVSHELRTPLAQIRMFAETLLLDRVRSPEERRRSLEIIDRESRRLTNLVENVMRFARGERGENRVSPERRDLVPLVREVLDGFTPLGANGLFQLSSSLPDTAVALFDDDAMRQVLVNLLDNAVKYGPAGQEVGVGVEVREGLVRLSVDDQGPGIPVAERDRVWKPFHRVERKGSHVAGAGIGLAVVHELIGLHHGTCRVEAAAGGGARFILDLPTGTAARATAP